MLEGKKLTPNQIECVVHWRNVLGCTYRKIATLFVQNFPDVEWVSESCQWSGIELCKASGIAS